MPEPSDRPATDAAAHDGVLRQFANVRGMVRALAGSEFADAFDRHVAARLESRALLTRLILERVRRGYDFPTFARMLGVSESVLADFEGGDDDDVPLLLMARYARMLGGRLEVTFVGDEPTGSGPETPAPQTKATA